MPSVNLIPVDVLRTRLRRRRVRFWLIAAGSAWLTASWPVAHEISADHQLRSQQTAVTAISAELHDAQVRCAKNAESLKVLKEQIARAARLRYRRPWTALLSAVADAIPVRVWLSSFSTDPPHPAVLPGAISAGPRKDGEVRSPDPSAAAAGYDNLAGKVGPRRLLLEGQALGLEDIYALVDGLQNLNVFAGVGIRAVSGDVVEEVKVTHFVVECDW